MRLNIIIINIIVLVMTGILHSQNVKDDGYRNNRDIYSELINKNLEVLENRLVLLGKDKIYSLSMSGNRQSSEFLNSVVRQRFYNFKIVTEVDSMNSDYRIFFDDIKFVTKYDEIHGSILKNRKVKRQIKISYNNLIKEKEKESGIFSYRVNEINNDEFYLERLGDVEIGDYDFLKGTLPEQSFFAKALIPGIVVLASAAAVILFFVIRSK